jgi:hypothetical protein
MSTAHDRHRKARRAAALMAEAALSQPEIVGQLGEWDLIRRGQVIFAAPQIRPEFPEPLKAALRRRRAAMLSGRCACEAAVRPNDGYGLAMVHNTGCPASDEAVTALYEAAGRTVTMVPPGMFGGM